MAQCWSNLLLGYVHDSDLINPKNKTKKSEINPMLCACSPRDSSYMNDYDNTAIDSSLRRHTRIQLMTAKRLHWKIMLD